MCVCVCVVLHTVKSRHIFHAKTGVINNIEMTIIVIFIEGSNITVVSFHVFFFCDVSSYCPICYSNIKLYRQIHLHAMHMHEEHYCTVIHILMSRATSQIV